MKLNYDKKSDNPTYFIQQGFRNGKKTTTKNIVRIGRHNELLAQGIKDPLAYAKEQVAEYNKKMKEGKVTIQAEINFTQKVPFSDEMVSASLCRNIGYFFLQAIYTKFDLGTFFKELTAGSKIQFDPDEVNRFLTFARVIDPGSKLYTLNHLNRFYENPSFSYDAIEQTMDLIWANYDAYISRLYEKSKNVTKRDTSVCYFDCTNYYFEIETEDEDYEDPVTGEIIPGIRKFGLSKEHRPNPIVEMGLFIDGQGIPVSMCIADSGSDNEQTLAIPLEKKITKMFSGKEFIYCADSGLNSIDIRKFNSMGGRSFIVSQSIKKLSNVLQTAVFNDYDYKLLSNGEKVGIASMKSFDKMDKGNLHLYQDKAYKILTADRAVDTGLTEIQIQKNGKKKIVPVTGELKQNIIITFSRKSMEYQRHVRNRQIERAKKMLKNIDPETYKKGPHDVTRFIKKEKKTAKSEYHLDEERIHEEEKYDGFYAVATNLERHNDETETEYVKRVIGINANRYKIEDCFRITKTNFTGRPAYHHLDRRIKAHFIICYTALLVYRLMETKLNEYGKKLEKPEHYTICEIIETLKNMEVVDVQDMYYMSTYTGSKVLNALNGVFGLQLDKKYYQPKELNRMIKKMI